MKKYHHVKVSNSSGERVRTVPFGSNILARISYPEGSRPGKKRARRGQGKGQVISLLFAPHAFTMSEAKLWAKKHGYSVKGSAKAGTTERRVPKRRNKKSAKRLLRRANGHLCKVCKKPIKQNGPGRPRLRHERCKN